MAATTIPKTTRLQRGVRLFRDKGHEIERLGIHEYRVPSCTGTGFYDVFTDMDFCSCPDHRRAKASGERCKHYHAVEVFVAKRRAARRRVAV